MSKVVFDISMSLDGFITAANQTPEDLHDWAQADGPADGSTTAAVPDTWQPDVFGAIIAGRRTYEDSLPWWGPNGPSVTCVCRWLSSRMEKLPTRRTTASTLLRAASRMPSPEPASGQAGRTSA